MKRGDRTRFSWEPPTPTRFFQFSVATDRPAPDRYYVFAVTAQDSSGVTIPPQGGKWAHSTTLEADFVYSSTHEEATYFWECDVFVSRITIDVVQWSDAAEDETAPTLLGIGITSDCGDQHTEAWALLQASEETR